MASTENVTRQPTLALTEHNYEDTILIRNVSLALMFAWFVIVIGAMGYRIYKFRKKRRNADTDTDGSISVISGEMKKFTHPPPSYAECVCDLPTYVEAMDNAEEMRVVSKI